MISHERLLAAYESARNQLLAERCAGGHWVGALSSSALSTATAVSALSLVRRHRSSIATDESTRLARLIEQGLSWIRLRQNADGGWGDTDRSYSNIATTMLCKAAFHLGGAVEPHASLLQRADQYIAERGHIAGLRRRYGRDKTFAVPILTNAALAGLVDWSEVSPLPFELACLPQAWYRFARLPVVSYAIPALVAVGQARFVHRPPRFAPLRWLRRAAVERSLSVLRSMQPDSGGYLEATPLTSFVVMSLAAIGRADHPVTQSGVRFLLDSVRADGSWPIDANLATWNTTLAMQALSAAGDDGADTAQLDLLPWLLSCQHRRRHPFTGADPGGWGWTDLSGAVPDADDTPSALLALAQRHRAAGCTRWQQSQILDAAAAGLRWILGLQNRDGGWPTFCRGWGKLPFDRSGADLTAHALRALHAWRTFTVHPALQNEKVTDRKIQRAVARGVQYLRNAQHSDGAWIPLWFGNQEHPREENPVYGTAKVLLAYRDFEKLADSAAERGLRWLARAQLPDGGWGAVVDGGAPVGSVEETALACEALAAAPEYREIWFRGLSWLVEHLQSASWRDAAPIGFYFAKLWYYETLYPVTFATAALGTAVRQLGLRSSSARCDLPAHKT
jgi:squalene-hopene/tetraprenyl-beta-curcumene cyclase